MKEQQEKEIAEIVNPVPGRFYITYPKGTINQYQAHYSTRREALTVAKELGNTHYVEIGGEIKKF